MPETKRKAKKRMKLEENQSFSSPLSSMICMPPMAMVRKAEAEVVHFEEAGAVGLDPRGIFNEARDEEEGEDADGDVDVEDPAPGEVVGDPAAEGGADGRGENGDEAVESEGLAALLGLEGVGHDGLGHGLQAAAAGSLKDAEEKQHGQRKSRAAEKAGDVKMMMQRTKKLRRPRTLEAHPPSGKNDGVGDEIAGEDPGAFVGAGAEGAGDVGQGDVGDGGVEDFHEGREGNGHGDEPGIDPGLPGTETAGFGLSTCLAAGAVLVGTGTAGCNSDKRDLLNH
jgi:hypothetical protein